MSGAASGKRTRSAAGATSSTQSNSKKQKGESSTTSNNVAPRVKRARSSNAAVERVEKQSKPLKTKKSASQSQKKGKTRAVTPTKKKSSTTKKSPSTKSSSSNSWSVKTTSAVKRRTRSSEPLQLTQEQAETVTSKKAKKTKAQPDSTPSSSSSSPPSFPLGSLLLFDEQSEYGSVCGVDEAGRGPLAGPVVAAAAIVPVQIHGINDSKKLSEDQREYLYSQLVNHPQVCWSVSIIDHTTIDSINILQATMNAMEECVVKLREKIEQQHIDKVLIDGNRIPQGISSHSDYNSQYVIKGDAKVYSIAAASIIAKVTRDRIMMQFHQKWPQYGFDRHKGYGVASHMSSIYRHGPCPIHRMTFAPMRHMKQS